MGLPPAPAPRPEDPTTAARRMEASAGGRSLPSWARCAAARAIGPVAVEADYAPFDAVSPADDAEILADPIDDFTAPVVAHIGACPAIAPGYVVEPIAAKTDLPDAIVAEDFQLGIPIFALLLREAILDARQHV